jgi:hypothetical protein
MRLKCRTKIFLVGLGFILLAPLLHKEIEKERVNYHVFMKRKELSQKVRMLQDSWLIPNIPISPFYDSERSPFGINPFDFESPEISPDKLKIKNKDYWRGYGDALLDILKLPKEKERENNDNYFDEKYLVKTI